MENGCSEVVEYFIKNLKIDTTKFNEVCKILSYYFVYSIVGGATVNQSCQLEGGNIS